MNIKKLFIKKSSEEQSGNSVISKNDTLKSWENDEYRSAIRQKNILLFALIMSLIIIIFSLMTIRFLKKNEDIRPFVVEINKKSGIPTVVEPVTVETYSANEAIKRYFIMTYLKSREGYIYYLYNRDFRDVVRVLSSSSVYNRDYVPKFSRNNSASPINVLGSASTITVKLKSIIFDSEANGKGDKNSAQVRITLVTEGKINRVENKIVFLKYDFDNLNMNEQDRLINPLGFQVKLYRIEDENY